jgi:hypothetical protein
LTLVDSLGVIKRGVSYYKEKGERSWKGLVRHALDEEEGNGYEMVGLTESNSNELVFALGDDEEEEEYHMRQPLRSDSSSRPGAGSLLLQQYPSRTAPSRMSSGSDGTLHEEPLDLDLDSAHPKDDQQRGAFDDHAPDTDGHGQTTIWVPKENKMGMKRFGQICLTWLRRTQVVIAYVTCLSGAIVYTVCPTEP